MSANEPCSNWENAVAWLRQQPDEAQLVINCYYDDPLLEAAERYWHSKEWQAVRVLLSGCSGSALDVSAGRGIASYALAREGFSVTALEPDPSKLVGAQAICALASESQLPIQVVEGFSEQLPFADGTFGVIFARAALHHTKDLEAACRECFRVLKPGGLFLAIREHVISNPADLPHFLEQHPLHRLYGGEHAFLLKQYIFALAQAGFKQPDVISPWHSPINFSPYTLTLLKDELAERAGLRISLFSRIIRALLDIPGVWPLSRWVLARVDHRPGRLYSFVAIKY